MDDTDILTRVDDLRSRGNDFFRTERYDEAIGVYTEALDLLDDLACHGGHRVTLLNNRSLALYRKGNAYRDSMQDATSVLIVDDKNEKALYRRACCALMLDEPHQAAVDLKHLVTIRRTHLEGDQNVESAQKECADNVLALLTYARQVATYSLLTSHESAGKSDTDKDAVVQIETILEALWADAEGVVSDGNGDVNLNSELSRLQTLLETSVAGRAAFRAKGGLRLMWFHFTPAHATLVADALRAACKEGMEWSIVSRLITLVFEEKDCIDVASTALDLLTWAAGSWVWVKNHLLLERPASPSLTNGRSSTIGAVASQLASHQPPWHDLRMISSAVNLLTLYSTGPISPSLDVSSVVNVLLDAYHATEDCDSEESSAQKAADEEEAARLALLEKRRKVYNARVVAVRRRILTSLVQFCGQKSVMLQSIGLQRKKLGHQHLIVHSLVQKLVSDVLADLIAKAPKKTTPILGPDGIPAAYTKRPFAADWADNPAGDFLTTLDLDEKKELTGDNNSNNKQVQNAPLPSGPSAPAPTLIELTVTALIKACETTVTACQVAHRSKILDSCEELFKFTTPSIVVQAQTLYTVVCRTVPAAMEMALESGNISALSGIARFCENYRAVALDKLAVHVDACCGDDFYRLTDDPDLSLIPFIIAHLSTCDETDSKVRKSCIQLLRLCLDRKGRHNSAYSNIKGPWKGIENVPEFAKARKPTPHDEGFQHVFKAGFLNGGVKPAGATNTQSMVVETQQVMEKGSGSGDNVETTTTLVENEGDGARESDPDQVIESLPDLKDVYDSSPKDYALRQARSKWLALPAKERHRWAQTSSDVSIWVSVPGGTRAKEVTVTVSGQHITVMLSWYGKVLDGDLHAGVKSQEMTWCIEASTGDEVHIVLPKDGAGRWWKSLLVGGEEKGYYEILKEAVHADEPTVPYDSMDPEAKELLDSLLERQAYVNAGLIDLENGFDDFRVVIGESSLGGPTSS